jgi:two-component system, cell cycle response regulator DivK
MNEDIVIIEDNEQNMYLMRFLLEKNGFSVVEAPSAADGIAKVLALGPQAVLLDIQLPDMDGYAVAGHLRTFKDMEAMPIIAVTSYAMVGDREAAMAAGCTGYIEKPINPDTFIDQLRQYLAGRQGKRAQP